uniref:Peptidase_S9 domain-containing protein n=1 Tax=Rhabditophanes sp. KR3021 TaxID=114890 RepID=A0AC35UBE3_9BILA
MGSIVHNYKKYPMDDQKKIEETLFAVNSHLKKNVPVKLGNARVYENVFGGMFKNIIVGLASAGVSNEGQNVYFCNLDDSGVNVANREFFSLTHVTKSSRVKSEEITLMYERLRGTHSIGVTDYDFSNDCTLLLFIADGLLYKFNGSLITELAAWNKSPILRFTAHPKQCNYVAFSSGKQLHIAFMANRLYSTTSTKKDETNGIASYVVQEELERYIGFWWSPTKLNLLYENVDEEEVENVTIAIPGNVHVDPIKYPFAGKNNAVSKLKMIKINDQTKAVDCSLQVNLKELYPWYEYIARTGWTPDGEYVFATLLDRRQTRLLIILISIDCFQEVINLKENYKDKIFEIYEETSNIWINCNQHLNFIPNFEGGYYMIYGSEKNNKSHLFLLNFYIKNGRKKVTEERQITSGDFCVIKDMPIKIDVNRGLVYFCANLFVTRVQLTERSQLTLDVNFELGFVASISNLMNCHRIYYCPLDFEDNSILPKVNVMCEIYTNSINMRPAYQTDIQNIVIPQLVKFTMPSTKETHYALVFLPKVKESKKFPVVQYIYCGPGVQCVKDSWELTYSYQKYVAFGMAVVILDGRGSSNRGIEFEAPIRDNLGTVEIEDQAEGLLTLNEMLNGVLDLDKVAVTGYSYGGYSSIRCLQKKPKIYKGAIAGGAVIDWKLYDSAYTEKYIGCPNEIILPNYEKIPSNINVYNKCGLMEDILRLPTQKDRLLVVHGLLDENVHVKHIFTLTDAMLERGIPFEQIILPHERHGVKNSKKAEFLNVKYIQFLQKLFHTLSKTDFYECIN